LIIHSNKLLMEIYKVKIAHMRILLRFTPRLSSLFLNII